MSGDLLDLVLLALVAGFALAGYRQGFLVGAISFAGFLGGGLAGSQFAAPMARIFLHQRHSTAAVIAAIFLCAAAGQLVSMPVGIALRRRLRWRPAEVLDAAGGGALTVAGFLIVAWMVGTALAHSPYRPVAREVQRSGILTAVDSAVPPAMQTWFAGAQTVFDRSGFPQVFGGLGTEHIVAVTAPDPALLSAPAVGDAKTTVVKVLGAAPGCGVQVQGSGFFYARHHVMTNAHVVAGVRRPRVIDAAGRTFDATVVLYDPERDVAVLYVPGDDAVPLAFAAPAGSGSGGVVVGYPENGGFTVRAARLRGRIDVRGPDIYHVHGVQREIYSLRSVVRPGNSGGPLLSPSGEVLGVVFAASLDDPQTGYALTAAEVEPDARAAAGATAQVPTQQCRSD